MAVHTMEAHERSCRQHRTSAQLVFLHQLLLLSTSEFAVLGKFGEKRSDKILEEHDSESVFSDTQLQHEHARVHRRLEEHE